MAEPNLYTGLEIAVVGMAGRFPGAASVDELWSNLVGGVESVSRFTPAELGRAGVDPALIANPDYVPAGGVIDGADLFDAGFFGYSPREAALIDPQQRLFLELAWTAMEQAGYAPGLCEAVVGVYGGVGVSDYLLQHVRARDGEALDQQAVVANDKDFAATRVSYKLNLRGPSFSVQTACSTSLVAIHLACQGLLSGDCEMALAGGISVRSRQRVGYLYQEDGIVSPDGHCRAFSARAQGCVPGNGGGVVVLKPLAQAIEDRDTIHAVIKGSAINNDGARKVGFTAPGPDGQFRVIRAALGVAGVSADRIGYLEAHGTGTLIGDPIEIGAASRAFREDTARRGYCAVGSVKSNLGHLDAGAGVTGFIKAALAVRDGVIPPTLHGEPPNPHIDFAGSPFVVSQAVAEWRPQDRRLAGVSAFGIGGTNAHVVLEEPPALEPPASTNGHELIVLSAKSAAALEQASAALAGRLDRHPPLRLADVGHTLRRGRAAMPYRRALVSQSAAAAAEALRQPGRPARAADTPPPVVFLFPGQGAQYPGMASGLYRAFPEFRRHLDYCAGVLAPRLGCDLRDFVAVDAASSDQAARLQDTRVAQPAIFSVSYALAQLVMAWGVQPAAMIGHSVGEYTAACLAGVLTLDEALVLVADRGALVSGAPRGAMAAVPLGEDALRGRLPDEVVIAALNAPDLCVVSGPDAAVRALLDDLRGAGVDGRMLHTSHAFHSPMLDPVVADFEARVSRVSLRPPALPYLSNVTGTWMTAADATSPAYYARHLRHTVRFSEGLGAALAMPGAVFVELGPGQALTALARRHAASSSHDVLAVAATRHPGHDRDDEAVLLDAVGQLWVAGVDVAAHRLPGVADARRVPLPTYHFGRDRHWIEAPVGVPASSRRADVGDWFARPSWERLAVSDPSPVTASSQQGEAGRLADTRELWVVLLDAHGVGADIASGLQALGGAVVTIAAPGRQDSAAADFLVEPGVAAGYHAVAAALQARGRDRLRVVHCLTIDDDREATSGLQSLETTQARGFFSLLYLAQALGDQAWLRSWQLGVVTSHLYDVVGGEPVWPEKATILGPCRTIPLEYAGVRSVVVDVRPTVAGTAARRASVDHVLVSLLEAGAATGIVAVRGVYRWRQSLAPAHLAAVDGMKGFKAGGVYLITGGLRGVGLALAEHLGRTLGARLVLVGRTPVPPRQDWAALAATAAMPDAGTAASARAWGREALAGLARAEATLLEAHVAPAPPVEGQRALDELCTLYALRFFAAAGLDPSRPSAHDRRTLAAACGVLPKFARYVEALVTMLVDDGYAAADGATLTFAGRRPPVDLDVARASARATNPALVPMLEVLDAVGDQLPAALGGEVPAVQLLFGDDTYAAFQRAVQAIRAQSWVPICETLVGALVASLARKGPDDEPLRILEIGGGEGLLTRTLLPRLRGTRVEYTFTDIGRSFVMNAERRAAADGDHFLRARRLDISTSPRAQGFAAGRFDVVLAFNVLHATPDVAVSLSHARELLAPGGLLVLQESVRPARWVDVIWGLTDGWWLFDDAPRRRASPLLPVDGWSSALRDAGFEEAQAFPSDAARAHADTAVLVGVAPAGVVSEAADGPAATVRALQRIEAAGGQADALTADVADPDAMRAAVEHAERRFGRLDGVVHAALVLHDGAIQQKTAADVADVFRPKVLGTLALKAAVAGRPLDVFVLFSSLVSTISGAGQVDYCAASNFQDAFACAEQGRLARRVLSVDWAAWREVGKAYRSAVARGASASDALPDGMSTAEGFDALSRALATGSPQVIVSPEDPAILEKRRLAEVEGATLDGPATPPFAAGAPAAVDPPEAEGAANETERVIAAIWSDVLGVPRVGPDDNFFDLGGDSLISLQFIARAKKAGLRLTNRQVFEHETVAALAAVATRVERGAEPGGTE